MQSNDVYKQRQSISLRREFQVLSLPQCRPCGCRSLLYALARIWLNLCLIFHAQKQASLLKYYNADIDPPWTSLVFRLANQRAYPFVAIFPLSIAPITIFFHSLFNHREEKRKLQKNPREPHNPLLQSNMPPVGADRTHQNVLLNMPWKFCSIGNHSICQKALP